MSTSEDDFESVAAAPADAELDPHYAQLRGKSDLPTTYMPPSMSGGHGAGTRITAAIVVGTFLLAAAAGVCLTYGPKIFG